MIEVTQEDRDLVAWFARRSDTIRAFNRDGAIDRLIATHRTTALAAKEAELAAERAKVEKLREALEELCANKVGARPRALRALGSDRHD